MVEAKAAGDADAEELAIREINAGTYAFDAAPLAEALAGLSNDNAQGEYYLPDVFPALREAGHSVAAHLADDLAVTMGVNNRADLAAVEAEARRRILEAPHARRRHRRRPRLDLGRRRASRSPPTPGSSPAPACAARPRSAPAPSSAR